MQARPLDLELMETPPRRPRVLLAEDETEMRGLIARTLRKEQCEIVEARDGAQLIRLLITHLLAPPEGREPVDLIISDVRMPGANGLDVIAALRRQDAETPVILITAFGDADTHLEAYRLGAVMVMNKPFEMDDLRVVVRSLVEPTI
jgi:two-component system response regulator (stage 0 sporulation protein F)